MILFSYFCTLIINYGQKFTPRLVGWRSRLFCVMGIIGNDCQTNQRKTERQTKN